mgnify:CR=1 FL=1
MIIKNIYYDNNFVKRFKKLPLEIQKIANNKVEIFKKNPLHPSLRLHMLTGKLSGIWSISLSKNYRLIFERMENGDILFLSIGSHDIYKYL